MQLWVFSRDGFKCIYCGKSSIEDGVKLVIEHIFPRFYGGLNTFYNVVTSCTRCNFEKSSGILPESIIRRIWERNKKLGVKYPYKYTTDIIKEFESVYPVNKSDLFDLFV